MPVTNTKHCMQGVSNEEATKELFNSQPSIAGVNAAHRAVPIAMAPFIEDSALPTTTSLESSITHLHHLSIQTAVVVNVICRALIRGQSWQEALEKGRSVDGLDTQIKAALEIADGTNNLSKGGFAPDVLKASVYFTSLMANGRTTFSEALALSLTFAGEVNFCPVLVGAFCGAQCGSDAIPKHELSHHRARLLERIDKVAVTLASAW